MRVPVPILGAYAFGLALILLLGLFLVIPLKVVLRLIYNGLIGGVSLWLINLVGSFFGVYLPITVWTALIVGFLGVPGVVLLLVYYALIVGKPM